MRKSRRRHLAPASPFLGQGGEWSNSPVRAQLKIYAQRLLEAHDLTEEFLCFILSLLSNEARGELINFLCRNGDPEECIDLVDELNNPASIAERILNGHLNVRRPATRKQALYKKIRQVWREDFPKSARTPNPFGDRLSKLLEVFPLTDDDFQVIVFFFCYSQCKTFNDLCHSHKYSDYLRLISICTGLTPDGIRKVLGKRGRLLQNDVVSEKDKEDPPFHSLDNEIIDFMAGMDDIPLAKKYCREDDGPAFELASFSVPGKAIKILQSLLSSPEPSHILLYGMAGTGKTEFAKALIRSCGKKAFFVQPGENGTVSERRLPLRVAAATIAPRDGILIVDEADGLLNTQSVFFMFQKTLEKGWLNDFLDQCPAKIIWITNEIDGIETSVRRRFAYSWHFRNFTRLERRNIWNELTKEHPLRSILTADVIRDLAAGHDVNAAGIGSALHTIKALLPEEKADPATARELLDELLTRHRDLVCDERREPLHKLPVQYDLCGLNTDQDPKLLLAGLRDFLGHKARNGKEDGGMNFLFWGSPGTGKTEFAKFLAAETGLDLIIKRASDLLNLYVGETEKNIKEAFDEAERQKAILFIDEADSFFVDRTRAFRSWEVTQTNELLTQMEGHNGILICCTNLLHNLDKAALRRFTWKVEFRPLTAAAKVALFERYFSPKGPELSEQLQARLQSIPALTPGDIKAVWQRYRFLPEAESNMANIITALEKEAFYKGEDRVEKIGF